MSSRSEALEAVAEAARLLRDALPWVYEAAKNYGPTEAKQNEREIRAFLARLDATHAPATSTPPTPTGKDLYALFRDERRKWLGGMQHRCMPEERACVALYNAGRAACVARLREYAAEAEQRHDVVTDGAGIAMLFRRAADTLESER